MMICLRYFVPLSVLTSIMFSIFILIHHNQEALILSYFITFIQVILALNFKRCINFIPLNLNRYASMSLINYSYTFLVLVVERDFNTLEIIFVLFLFYYWILILVAILLYNEDLELEILRQLRQPLQEGMPQEQIDKLQCRTKSPYQDQEEQVICSICYSEILEDQLYRTLICQHLYHQSCIDLWLVKAANCPNCKRELA